MDIRKFVLEQKEKNCPIRKRGFGMYVIDVQEDIRLHVWPKADHPLTVIHDHHYDFHSEILVGRLQSRIYAVEFTNEKSPYRVFNIKTAPNQPLALCPLQWANASKIITDEFTRGQEYDFYKGDFHESYAVEFSISWMKMLNIDFNLVPKSVIEEDKVAQLSIKQAVVNDKDLWTEVLNLMEENGI